ncbi:hypothetical protein E8E13_004678 [Curvularia kusanoi]|uniref:Ketoreductase (KR) domain-containing protein n=1 Tax=Curvularia kusanoi TaxID=90978 RepID=A0A9P4TP80_CURKU|nr:hypothetical protein E8E13_004678 [Curvularia kusanoi]
MPRLEIRFSKVFLTCRSHDHLEKLRITGRATLIDRRSALQQPAFQNFFEAILTDEKDDLPPLCNIVKPGGRVVALGQSASVGMRSVAGLFLRKGATIGVFHRTADFAKVATQQIEIRYAAEHCGIADEAAQKRTLLAEALGLLRRGVVSSSPCERFDLAKLPEAINRLAQGDFVGSAIITRTAATRIPIRVVTSSLTFNPDASYLLVGCLGGLGRSLAAWMTARGARHFIFLSRSGADKPEAAALLEELHELARSQHPDLTAKVIRGDVSIRDDVSRAISSASKPTKGVVQVAMVLKE